MNNKKLLLVALAAALTITVTDMLINRRHGVVRAATKKRKRAQSRRAQAPAPVVAQVAAVVTPVDPGRAIKAGDSMTVREFFDRVQGNTEAGSVLVATDAKGLPIIGDVAGKIAGSRSPRNLGITLDDNTLNQQVTLKSDSALIEKLAKEKRLVRTTKKRYANALVYAEVDVPGRGTIRFFNIEPFPGKVRTTRGTTVNQALKELNHWEGK